MEKKSTLCNCWERSGDCSVVKIDNFDEETVKTLIDYLYVGTLEEKCRYTPQLLAIAHQY